MTIYYTGVGSRKTPKDICEMMTRLARDFASFGYILRSGGAVGADKALEKGAGNLKEIYYAKDATQAAMEIAAYFHPVWERLSIFAKKLHGRNAFQVLGYELQKPSSFLVCWTPDGVTSHAERKQSTGGTGTAISIASHFNVPVFNLQNLKR